MADTNNIYTELEGNAPITLGGSQSVVFTPTNISDGGSTQQGGTQTVGYNGGVTFTGDPRGSNPNTTMAARAFTAALNYARANGDEKMSKREQRRWRKDYGISKRNARLMRRAINAKHKGNDKLAYGLIDLYKNRVILPEAIKDYYASAPYRQQQQIAAQKKQAEQEANKKAQAQWAAKKFWDTQSGGDAWAGDKDWTNITSITGGGQLGIQHLQESLNMNSKDGKFGKDTWQAIKKKLNGNWDTEGGQAGKQKYLNSIRKVLNTSGLQLYNLDKNILIDELNTLDVTDDQKREYIRNAITKGDFNPFNDDINNAYAQYKQDSKDYYADLTFKLGGRMRTRYFQEGGAAPQESGQDLQAQVIQLVQAAMSGDEKATQAIEQIVAAAKQGDEQAAQIAQMIQAVAEQLEQGQAQAAKMGAKLSYLHSLKTGCPSGYEVAYRKQGGHICKECVKKNQGGQRLTEAERKAKGIGTPEQVEAAARRNKRRYPQYTMDQCKGAAPIIKNGKEYYMGGDGSITPAKKPVSKHQFGGRPELKHVVPTVSGTGYDQQLAQRAAEEIYKGRQLADIYYATEAAKARKAMLATQELNRIQAAKAIPTVAVPTTPVAVVEQVPMEVEGTIQGLPVVVHKKGGCLKRKLCKGKKVVGKNAAGGYVQMHKSDPAETTEQGGTTGTTQGTITGGPEKKKPIRSVADALTIAGSLAEAQKKSQEQAKQIEIASKIAWGNLPPKPADNAIIIGAEPISAETGEDRYYSDNWIREAKLQRQIKALKAKLAAAELGREAASFRFAPVMPLQGLGFKPEPMKIEGGITGMVPATYRVVTNR